MSKGDKIETPISGGRVMYFTHPAINLAHSTVRQCLLGKHVKVVKCRPIFGHLNNYEMSLVRLYSLIRVTTSRAQQYK